MSNFRGALIVVLWVSTATAVCAQDEEEGLSGQIALGYLATSGNSESENMSLGFGGDYYGDVWHHNLEGRAVRASTSNVTTAEAYSLSWQSDRELGEKSYVFGRAAWDKDKFSGYDQQIREVVGYGRRFVDTDRHALNAEIGAGFRQSDLRDGTQDDETILRLAMDYTLQISETAEFEQRIGVERGDNNTYTESITALKADIWSDLALVFSYTIKRNSNVPVGIKKEDSFTALSLEYSF